MSADAAWLAIKMKYWHRGVNWMMDWAGAEAAEGGQIYQQCRLVSPDPT